MKTYSVTKPITDFMHKKFEYFMLPDYTSIIIRGTHTQSLIINYKKIFFSVKNETKIGLCSSFVDKRST